MSKKRKEKVAEVTAARESRTISPDTTQKIESLDKPSELAETEQRTIQKINNDITAKAVVANPKADGLAVSPMAPLPKLSTPTAQAQAMQTGGIIKKKAPTFSELLEPARQSAIKEKTDAEKMQRYYALTDALNAIGKMGGAVVGGAVGGNILDSAPNVGDYQRSAGYIDAFEKAKQANERLKNLEDKNFQLALRDEERSYQQQLKQEERNWQMTLAKYNNAMAQAIADKNFERSRQLQLELAQMKQNHEKNLSDIRYRYETEIKKIGSDTVQKQYDLYHPKKQIVFDNGTGIEVTDAEYKGMYDFFAGKPYKDGFIDKDNFSIFLRSNPQLVNDYLKIFGKGFLKAVEKPESDYSFPLHISQVPADKMNSAQTTEAVEKPESTSNGGLSIEDLDKKWGANK